MLISDEDFELAASDAELAFAQLARTAEDRLNEIKANGRHNVYELWSEYASTLKGVHEALELELGLDFVPPANEENFDRWLETLRFNVNAICTRIRMRASRKGISPSDPALRFEAVDLSEYRDEILTYTRKIRKIVRQIDIEESLRELLFDRLNAFEKDLERNRTRWESFFSLFRIATRAVGEGAEELEPAVRLVERIAAAIDKASQNNLIGNTVRKLLKGPTATDAERSDSLDDDIPF